MNDLFPDDAEATARALELEAERLTREREAAESRLREHEADFTAHEIARRQIGAGWLVEGEHPAPSCTWILPDGRSYIGTVIDSLDLGQALRVLDIGAGAGVWSAQLRLLAARHGFDVHITAVELRPEERIYLERVADEVIIGHWLEAFAGGRTYDLVVGNPPFTEARAPVRPEWPINPAKGSMSERERKAILARNAEIRRRLIDEKLAELADGGADPRDRDVAMLAAALAEYDPHKSMVAVALRHAPAVFLYLSQQGWTKTASGWLTRLHYPPAATYDVPGSISHREGGGGDSISYASTLWLRGHKGPAQQHMLHPFASRSWKVRPGTEPDAWFDAQGIPLLVRGVAE